MLSVRHNLTKKQLKQEEEYAQQHNAIVLNHFPYRDQQFKFSEIPTLPLPKHFFTDPFRMINDLYVQKYDRIGIVKFIFPPDRIVPESFFFEKLRNKLQNKRLDTRTQVINELQSGNPFGWKPQGYSFDQFLQLANNFQQHYKTQGYRQVHNELRQQEIEFWSIVDYPEQFEDVEVEYAADLLASKFATGYEDQQLGNLNLVNKSTDCIFQVLNDKTEMSGISVPWLYLGMKYANFCWHCEDLNLNSLNYMHAGHPKTWYAIPPAHADKFREYFKKKYKEELKHNPRLLYDIVCQISPIELVENGIEVVRTDQRPGELIVTLGETFHAGFSHGLNCSEAVNVAPINWLDVYDKAIEEYRGTGNLKKVSFPLEWLLIKIANQHDTVKFTKLGWTKISKKFETIKQEEVKYRKLVLNTYENVKIVEYINKQEKYDRNVCKICAKYMFLSYIYCGKCLKKGCTQHVSICACANPKMTLYLRYNDQELEDMHKMMQRKIEESK